MKKVLATSLKGLAAATLVTVSMGAAAHANLVQNGEFDQTTYTQNHQFGSSQAIPGTNQGVTDWNGNGGYNLYFFSGTDTTKSAISQYDPNGTGKEMLYPGAGGTDPSTTDPNATVADPKSGNFVGLDGDTTPGIQGGISQQINGLTVGALYEVSFDWGAGQVQSRSGDTSSSLTVSLGGESHNTGMMSNPSGSFTGWFHSAFDFTATSTSELLSFLAVGSPTGLPPMAVLDSVTMNKVPEPMSIALLGVGLVGLGAARRRRKG